MLHLHFGKISTSYHYLDIPKAKKDLIATIDDQITYIEMGAHLDFEDYEILRQLEMEKNTILEPFKVKRVIYVEISDNSEDYSNALDLYKCYTNLYTALCRCGKLCYTLQDEYVREKMEECGFSYWKAKE